MKARSFARLLAVLSAVAGSSGCAASSTASDAGADARDAQTALGDAQRGADASANDGAGDEGAMGDVVELDSAAADVSALDAPAPDSMAIDSARVDAARPDAVALDARVDAQADAQADVRGDAPVASDAPTTPGAGSAGCGRAAGIALNAWVARTLSVGGAPREYWVRLPTGYDPARRYPIVYQFHGCSDGANRQDNNVPVHNASGANAILVRGKAAASCWNTNATGTDVAYFDALLPAVEASFCADTSRRFATGYSSGSFMTHQLACIRGAQFRGVASIAGGQVGTRCTGNVAALLIHDANDRTVNISTSERARDSLAMRNGCNATAPRTPTARVPCEAYTGCTAGLPVVWCPTSMRDHDRQDSLAAPAFWEFFASLPAR